MWVLLSGFPKAGKQPHTPNPPPPWFWWNELRMEDKSMEARDQGSPKVGAGPRGEEDDSSASAIKACFPGAETMA